MVVRVGTRFKLNTAEGMYAFRVLRRHRDLGFWECVADAGPRAGCLQVMSRDEIVAANRKYGSWK